MVIIFFIAIMKAEATSRSTFVFSRSWNQPRVLVSYFLITSSRTMKVHHHLDHHHLDDDGVFTCVWRVWWYSGKFMTIFLADSFTGFLHQLKTEEEMDAELEAAELVGDEEEEVEEVEEEGEGGEEHDSEEDGEAVGHVAKRRRNEEGDEDVHEEADDDVDDEEDDDEANVGEKRRKPTDD